MGLNLNSISGRNRGEGQRCAFGNRARRQAIQIEGEMSQSGALSDATLCGSGSGNAQSVVGPSTKRSTGVAARGGDIDDDALMCAASLPMDRPDGEAIVHTRRGAERNAARHARFGGDKVLLVSASFSGQGEMEVGFCRHAETAADGVAKLDVEQGGFGRVLGNDPQRQYNVVEIANRMSASAIRKALRRWPQRSHRFDVLGAGEIQCRRDC